MRGSIDADASIRVLDPVGRRLSENDAYTLLRQTAMSQNKTLFEVAEAVISMEDMFPA